MTKPSPLLNNPEFLADLAGGESGRSLARKWPLTANSVIKYRNRLREGKPLSRVVSDDDALEPDGEDRTTSEEDSDGGRVIQFIRDRPVTLEDAREWIRSTGDNPDDYTLSVRSIAYGTGQSSNRMAAIPKRKALQERELDEGDLPALYAALRTATPAPAPAPSHRATVVVWSDPQIGKTGRRGGTPELLARSHRIRTRLGEILKERAPERILLADGGDGIEGFESGGNPMFTNDLSLTGQLDMYGTELFEWINAAHTHAPVTVMGVPSNHAAWRRGKQNLGRPQDDLGLFMHKQVAKITAIAGMSVDWVAPLEYDESVAVDFMGTAIGLTHGHQFAPGKAIEWWEKQTFGAGAVARADVMVTAHYHSFGAGVAGRNPASRRERWWLGAPTLDNGSDWFRQVAGRDSDPGLLIFDVTDEGFDLSSLTILS